MIDAVVPVYFEKGPRPIEVPAGSATEEAAFILPDSKVAGAFHNLSAEVLLDPDADLDADVLVTGSGAAKETALQLASEIKGARAIDSGPLRYSRFVEGITILLIGINSRYKTHTGVTINHIQPGFFDTDRYRAGIDAMAGQLKITHEEAHEQRIQEVPAKRAGTAEEFGEAAAFLCSLQAGYITGQSLLLDGGLFNSSF